MRASQTFREKLYGLSLEEYQTLVTSQAGTCAICRKPPGGKRNLLSVDHEHDTGDVRGLLCQRCNSGIGQFLDDPDLLRRAIAYLEKHQGKSGPSLSDCDRGIGPTNVY